MKHPTFLKDLLLSPTTRKNLPLIALLFLLSSLPFLYSVKSQTRPRTTGQSTAEPDKTAGAGVGAEVLKVDVDLITIDALVLQKQTARVVGDLTKEDFVLAEDGVRQVITHFSQDSLPLSVLLLVDRGGCLDPFGSEVRQAAVDAIGQLKPADEVALMTYHSNVELLQPFTRNRALISDALNRVPPHDEEANHCLNKGLCERG